MAEFQQVDNKLLDHHDVVTALEPIHYDWFALGERLNIPEGTLRGIADMYNNNHFRQMSHLISTWISRPTREHHPSWRVLCQALASMGKRELAFKIAGMKEDDQSIAGKTANSVTGGTAGPDTVAAVSNESIDGIGTLLLKDALKWCKNNLKLTSFAVLVLVLVLLNMISYLYKELDISDDTIRDLSGEISAFSPSIDKWEYGLSIDIDPSSLHPSSRHYVASIKVYSDNNQFSFPTGFEPLSAIYSISMEGDPLSTATPPPMDLKMMHFANPDDVKQLNQLTFAKMSDHSQSQFEIVPGGSFRPGDEFGEIKLNRTSLWAILIGGENIERGPPLYRGVVLYTQTSPIRWTMYLLVSRHKPKQMILLNEYMRNRYKSMPALKFHFKFKKSENLKISTREKMDEKRIISINGWTIAFNVTEITQESADLFEAAWDFPGHCVLKLEKHEDATDRRLQDLPIVQLSGIDSETKDIRIDPPVYMTQGSHAASSGDRYRSLKYNGSETIAHITFMQR